MKELCSTNGTFSSDLALADIINEDAEILKLNGKKDNAYVEYELSLKLYQATIAKEHATMSIEILSKIESLKRNCTKNIVKCRSNAFRHFWKL